MLPRFSQAKHAYEMQDALTVTRAGCNDLGEYCISPIRPNSRQECLDIGSHNQAGRVMARQHALPPTLPPRLIGRDAAAAYVSLAPNTFDVLVRNGQMPKPRILTLGRKAWDVRLLDQAIDVLPLDGEDRSNSDDGWDD